jgi:hypothetical protein
MTPSARRKTPASSASDARTAALAFARTAVFCEEQLID